MNTLRAMLLVALGLSVALAHSRKSRALNEFREMILCGMPDSWPTIEFSDYGCYCGKGGSGTPVDQLDRCCQVHDHCYHQAKQLDACWTIIDNPYTELYDYSCDEKTKKVTCGDSTKHQQPVDGFLAVNQLRLLLACCQVHDYCYNQAMQHDDCWFILDNPYTELYDYSCDKTNKKVTCGAVPLNAMMSEVPPEIVISLRRLK
ncbi:Phospholipase A2, major isoenzyme [Liparis tanakae]|uniref:Phospholipase A2 n=1 Tax=Liparis tanakae TaxID=230148 RepID=A0A4Z2HJF0_9TELE|nr:Phospholipase A2, major isoenzyme [Liparis tanakae]